MRHRLSGDDALGPSIRRLEEQVGILAGLTRKLAGITSRERREYIPGTRILELAPSAGDGRRKGRTGWKNP
jgi:hypothetical protein